MEPQTTTLPPPTTELILAPEQAEAKYKINLWFNEQPKPEFRLGGFAGTGKTTMIRSLLTPGGPNSVVCAFTGKAAHVLQKKGIPASTIHALIYNTFMDEKGGFHFELKTELPKVELIIVDEASMISKDLYRDLCSFGIPLLFIGDPGQLEPVGDNPNLMAKCDFTLTTIHRQALESPIIAYSQHIRTGGDLRDRSFCKPGELEFVSKNLSGELMHSANQIICAKNTTREILNKAMRRNLGFTDKLCVGEKVICLANNSRFHTFNGQMFTISEIKEETATSFEVVMIDEANRRYTVPIWADPFHREVKKSEHGPKTKVHVTYGYAVTCHKSQGSEWDHVVVVDEWMPPAVWDMKRWRYTAITRAAKKLSFAI